MSLDPKIKTFLKKHHVMTLATSKDNVPWVAHCFYAFMEEEMVLVFTTDPETRHGQEMKENEQVSVGISWETKIVGQIRGAQITGRVMENAEWRRENGEWRMQNAELRMKNAKRAYLKRFPYAILMKTTLWVLEIETIKYTDNRLGFGKKLHWGRESDL